MNFSIQSQQPIYRHFNTNIGLPSGSVYKIFQDSKGIIWFATSRGIARFDGCNIKNFNDNTEISSQEFYDIYEDEHDRIWFLSYSSFFTYYNYNDKKLHRIFNETSGIDVQPITHISYNKSRKIYFTNWIEQEINGKQLLSYFTIDEKNEIHKFEIYIPNNLFPVKKLGSENIHIVNDLKEFITTNNGLHYFSHLKHGVIAFDKFIAYNDVSNEIILVNDKKVIKRKLSDIFLGQKDVFRIEPLNNNLFCLYFEKKKIVVNQKLEIIPTYHFLDDFYVRNILIDRENSLWLSSRFEGVYYIKKSNFNSIFKNLNDKQITQIKKYNNFLYVGNSTGEIYELDAHNLEIKRKILNSSGFIKNIELSPDGKTMYVVIGEARYDFVVISLNNDDLDLGAISGLKIYREEGRKRYFSNSSIKNISSSASGIVLSTNDGMIHVDSLGKTSKFIPTRFRASHSIYDAKRELFWMGGPSGVLIYDNINDCLNETKISQAINKITIDHKNRIWIWTSTNELYRSDDSKIEKVRFSKSVFIKDIYLNSQGQLCVLTPNSVLYNVTEKQLTYHFKDFVDRNVITCASSNDTFYLGSKDGIIKTVNNTDPLPKFCQLQFNESHFGKSSIVNFDKITILKADENYFSTEIAFPCYDLNTEILIKHKLKGYDKEYQITNPSKIHYHKLTSGTYILEVIAENSDGQVISSISQTIKVLNFWYHSIWFYLCVFTLVSFVLYKIIQAYINKIKQKNDLQLALYKRMSESEIAALQNQLNPHFVSNVLTSIQSYIVNRSPMEASDYLNSFNKLLRLILESSRNNYLPLRQELLLLNKYLELENLRFHNTLDYQFIIQDDLDLNLEIPSMIIQPFLENAIIHGLNGLKHQPKLLIIFEFKDRIMNIYIHDNGHGIHIQKDGNTLNNTNHHISRGTEITKERMMAFSQQGLYLVSFDYIYPPFFNENGKGTSLMITIIIND